MVPGAERAVEFHLALQTFAMPGLAHGFFAVGNERLINALGRVKSYLDYGAFTPIQVAATAALDAPTNCIEEIRETYKGRRDVLVDTTWPALAGTFPRPRPASMFAWSPIPEKFRHLGSMGFATLLLEQADIGRRAGHRLW